jgi:hypothetical protein
MNIAIRIWRAIWQDEPEPEEESTQMREDEPLPWNECRWIELTPRCRCPLNDENMPSGCDAACPARLANEHRAGEREHENTVRLYH